MQLYKTRVRRQPGGHCRGKVSLERRSVKPAHRVRIGDRISYLCKESSRKSKVRAFPAREVQRLEALVTLVSRHRKA